ncbi:MAG: YkgJ family cysteine cluster protein [Lachnospiraceae bacterium]|nr:YkgJ family cysteine cluster protein [Lachnospiraceae bacterium]
MKREVRVEELQKLYTCNDMAKADCGGCQGCHACCQGMGSSVILDPYDMYQLERGLGASPQVLIGQGYLELNLADGLILPNLKMAGEQEQCVFLNEQGRCRIHSFRHGLCRLFPLGRVYEDDGFKYYVQLYECPKPVKTKVKISKWLGITDIKKYEEFVLAWHWLLKWCQELIEQAPDMVREDVRKKITMSMLSVFYMTPYDVKLSFYDQFATRRDMFVKQMQ